MEPSPEEEKLLEASKQLSRGLQHADVATLEALFADDITIHADGLSLGADLHGKKDAADWFKSYFDRYEFSHEFITGAVNDKVPDVPGGIAFYFWQDKNVAPKAGVFPDLPPEAKAPTTTVGIWHLCFDANHKVKDLWYLRELSADEVHRKLKKRVDMVMEFNPLSFKDAKDMAQSESRRKQILDAAECYNEMWETCNEMLADVSMAPDVQQFHPVLGHTHTSLKEFKEAVFQNYVKHWEVKEHRSHIAATAGNKAFIHWVSKGKNLQSGKEEELYGLAMLEVNGAGKIQRMVGFREFGSGEEQEYVKETYQRHSTKAEE